LSNDASGWAQTIKKNFLPAVNGGDTSYTITLKSFNNCDTISTTQRITVKQKPKAVLAFSDGLSSKTTQRAERYYGHNRPFMYITVCLMQK